MNQRAFIYITKKDWHSITALIDSLDDWRDQFGEAYKKDWEQFEKKTTPRVHKQLNQLPKKRK